MNPQTRMLLATAALLAAGLANAAEFAGTLQLLEDGQPAAAREYSDVVVFFIPESAPPPGAATAPGTAPIAVMAMRGKAFSPRVLPVMAGTRVTFTNFDPILHNAFSTARRAPFDLGFYGGGESREVTFDTPGLVRVYCNVHHDMVAYILVLNTPHHARSDQQGRFTLHDLPPGPGTLYIWHPRARALRERLHVAAEPMATGAFELALTERRIPRHLDKHGKSYRRVRGRRY